MKTVNKYILASCVFCYFMGLYLVVVKFGIMRFISRYGLHRIIDNWPEDFPSLNLACICLAVYTLFFALITYGIIKACQRHEKETEVLQQRASTLHHLAANLSLVVSRYNRVCREKNIPNKTQCRRLQLLEKQIAALPASVLNSSNAGSRIARIVEDINAAVADIETTTEQDFAASNIQLCNLVESAIEEVQRLRTESITIK